MTVREYTLKQQKERARKAVDLLKAYYPDAQCSLTYEKPHELLIATRLSAQCTDARVNMVTPALFAKYPTLESFAEANVDDVCELIKSCGLYKTKGRDIVAMCRMLIDEFNGIMPDTIEELTRLPGIGRKTANLMLGDVFHKPAVVVDTHCIRINGRLGFCEGKDAAKIEKVLKEILPPEESSDYCHRIVQYGRDICTARNPKCGECVLAEICPSYPAK